MKDFMHAITMVLEGKTVEVQQLDEKLTRKQQKLDLHEPEKDELTAQDFKMLRAKASPTKVCSMCGKSAKDCSCNMKEEAEIDEGARVEGITKGLRNISKHGLDSEGNPVGQYHAVVKKDKDYQEYQVHLYKNGKHMGEPTVNYENSKQDAQDTADHYVKLLNSRAMSEGAYTQHYMDANNPSPVRQAAEIAKAPKQKISFRKDPINAATNAMHDKALDVFQNFGKKKVAEEVSELDELSHDTLQSYKRKTRTKLYNLAAAGPAPEGSKRKAEIDKRVSGYRKAWQKQDDKFYQTEEVSELEELNKDTLYSYANKAKKNKDKQINTIHRKIMDNDPKSANAASHKFLMRSVGQDRAEKRLQKEQVNETTFKYNDFEIELDENFSYADYLNAVKTIVNSDDPSIQSEIISIAAEAYDTQDMNVIIEATTMAHAKSVVESLRKADINTTISNPEAVVLEGKPGFKYSKTNNGKTSVTIHTASGVVRKV